MRVVATARLRRAQEKVEMSRPYAFGLGQMVQRLIAHTINGDRHPSRHNLTPTQLLILLSSDRGLCGAFNHNLVKKAREILRSWQKANVPFYIVCLGRRGRDLLKHDFQDKMLLKGIEHIKSGASWDYVCSISQSLQEIIQEHQIGSVEVIFSRFRSVLVQTVTHQKIIPYEAIEEETESPFYYDLLEPSGAELIEQIQPINLTAQLYRIFWESMASEHGARITAMDHATRSAQDMIEKLQLYYNRTRQGLITKELIEVIAGAEAL